MRTMAHNIYATGVTALRWRSFGAAKGAASPDSPVRTIMPRISCSRIICDCYETQAATVTNVWNRNYVPSLLMESAFVVKGV